MCWCEFNFHSGFTFLRREIKSWHPFLSEEFSGQEMIVENALIEFSFIMQIVVFIVGIAGAG